MDFDLGQIHEAAVKIAKKGGDHTLNFFGRTLDIQRKEDHSPVTIADRETEQLMRLEIEKLFLEHGIVGEEFPAKNPGHPVQWILDPIDGTKSFIHGVPLYTTLVGVMIGGEAVAGVIYAPATGELCEAVKGTGCRLNGNACSVRSCNSLEEATFLTTDTTVFEEYNMEESYRYLTQICSLHRSWGDAYGHLLVATGRADLMIDPVLNIWDAAPLLPILQEAGGVFCDVHGHETIKGDSGISCSKELLDEVLPLFRENR